MNETASTMCDNRCIQQEQQEQQQQQQHPKQAQEPSYIRLLRKNREFRLYMSSYLISQAGMWFTDIATISLIQQILIMQQRQQHDGDDGQTTVDDSSSSSQLYISILFVVQFTATVVLSFVGGVVADSRDRLQTMIQLDYISAILAPLQLVAFYFQSIPMIYLFVACQQTVGGIYQPCQSAIVPMMVTDKEDLKVATTLTSIVWSAVAAMGACAGGFVMAWLGAKYCFLIDSFSFLLSAILLQRIGGKWIVSGDDDNVVHDDRTVMDMKHEKQQLQEIREGIIMPLLARFFSCWQEFVDTIIENFAYISRQEWGPLVFVKASTALIYGVKDVLNVSFSEMGEGNSQIKLGILFGVFGVGCVLGSIFSDKLTSMTELASLQRVMIWGIACTTVAFLGMSLFSSYFWIVGFFCMVQSAGASATWVTSSVLLQHLVDPQRMGRVMALDFALAVLTEATFSLICGVLQDDFHFSPGQVCLVTGSVGVVVVGFWTWFHISGKGAASLDLVRRSAKKTKGDFPSSTSEKVEPCETSPLLVV